MSNRGSGGQGGSRISYSRKIRMGKFDRLDACPICGLIALDSDDNVFRPNGQAYHKSCFINSQAKKINLEYLLDIHTHFELLQQKQLEALSNAEYYALRFLEQFST